jgi:hypothetical protein
MTPEEIGRMTIDELEEAASRVSAALSVLREAGAWRPADRPTAQEAEPAPAAPVRTLTPGPTVRFSQQEMAERERLLKQLRPDDIAALERQ